MREVCHIAFDTVKIKRSYASWTAHREILIKDFLQVTCLKRDGISNGFRINHETESFARSDVN